MGAIGPLDFLPRPVAPPHSPALTRDPLARVRHEGSRNGSLSVPPSNYPRAPTLPSSCFAAPHQHSCPPPFPLDTPATGPSPIRPEANPSIIRPLDARAAAILAAALGAALTSFLPATPSSSAGQHHLPAGSDADVNAEVRTSACGGGLLLHISGVQSKRISDGSLRLRLRDLRAAVVELQASGARLSGCQQEGVPGSRRGAACMRVAAAVRRVTDGKAGAQVQIAVEVFLDGLRLDGKGDEAGRARSRRRPQTQQLLQRGGTYVVVKGHRAPAALLAKHRAWYSVLGFGITPSGMPYLRVEYNSSPWPGNEDCRVV